MESFEPEPYDMRVQQGATFSHVMVLAEWGDASGAITPENLTGCTARMHVRKRPEDSAILIDLTTENGRITLGGANGVIQLTLSHSETQTIPAVNGFYDLELVSGDTVSRLVSGRFIVSREITRP